MPRSQLLVCRPTGLGWVRSQTVPLTTALAGANNDMVFTARIGGPGGNSIRLAYLVAGCYALGEHYYAKGNA